MRTIIGLFMGIACLFIGLHDPFGFWDAVGYGIIFLTIVHKLREI